MKPLWTGDIVKLKHVYEVSNKELADECGYEESYISAILSGKKGNNERTRSKLENAIQVVIRRKNALL